MKKLIIIIIIIIILSIITSLLLTSCSIDWDNEKENRITNLEKQLQKLNTKDETNIPEVSFKSHIIQFGGIHSSIYDGVFWNISSLDNPYPMSDSSISDIKDSGIKIDYRGRKDFFTISCPIGFKITNCSINNNKINNYDNLCHFYLPTEGNKNSDISFICNNGKLSTPLF